MSLQLPTADRCASAATFGRPAKKKMPRNATRESRTKCLRISGKESLLSPVNWPIKRRRATFFDDA